MYTICTCHLKLQQNIRINCKYYFRKFHKHSEPRGNLSATIAPKPRHKNSITFTVARQTDNFIRISTFRFQDMSMRLIHMNLDFSLKICHHSYEIRNEIFRLICNKYLPGWNSRSTRILIINEPLKCASLHPLRSFRNNEGGFGEKTDKNKGSLANWSCW